MSKGLYTTKDFNALVSEDPFGTGQWSTDEPRIEIRYTPGPKGAEMGANLFRVLLLAPPSSGVQIGSVYWTPEQCSPTALQVAESAGWSDTSVQCVALSSTYGKDEAHGWPEEVAATEDVLESCRRGGFLPLVRRSAELVGECFASVEGMRLEFQEDPETGQSWFVLAVRVVGGMDAVLGSFDAYTERWVGQTTWPESDSLRLSLEFS